MAEKPPSTDSSTPISRSSNRPKQERKPARTAAIFLRDDPIFPRRDQGFETSASPSSVENLVLHRCGDSAPGLSTFTPDISWPFSSLRPGLRAK